MMNLINHNTVANMIKVAGMAYSASILAVTAAGTYKRNIRKTDINNDPVYLVVNIYVTTTTSDLCHTIEEVEYDCTSPLMSTKDKVAARKHFDYLRGQGRKVALLVTDPFQLFASSVANNHGFIDLSRSGLMVISRCIDNDGKYSMPSYHVVVKDIKGNTMLIDYVDGADLMSYFESKMLVARIDNVNGVARFHRVRDRNSGLFRYSRSRVLEKSEILG